MGFDLNKGGDQKKKFDLSKSTVDSALPPISNRGLNSGKEKRKSFLWLFILIGILIIVGGVWYFNANNNSDRIEKPDLDETSLVEAQTIPEVQEGNVADDADNQNTPIEANNSPVLPYENNVSYQVYQFPFGSADYTQSNPELDKLVEVMKQNPNVKISIDAYTDNVGSQEFNQVLSERRAKAINDYIISKGIDASRISHHGKGISTKFDLSAENRRVEFIISN